MKLKLAFIGLFLSIATAFAGSDIESLNRVLFELLKPFRNGVTSYVIKFEELSYNEKKISTLGLRIEASKTGKLGEIKFSVPKLFLFSIPDNLNADKSNLVVDFNASLQANNLNDFNTNVIIKYIQQLKKQFYQEKDGCGLFSGYSNAVTCSLTDKNELDDSNKPVYVAKGSVGIDITKLPKQIETGQVLFTSFEFGVNLSQETLTFQARITLNDSDQKNEQDLIKGLTRLIEKDEAEINKASLFIQILDQRLSVLADNGFDGLFNSLKID